jgi:[acyl-carrier-protein] S-malonyltransferase
MTAGFSLGEIAALAYSGAVSVEDGFKLVCKRAQ